MVAPALTNMIMKYTLLIFVRKNVRKFKNAVTLYRKNTAQTVGATIGRPFLNFLKKSPQKPCTFDNKKNNFRKGLQKGIICGKIIKINYKNLYKEE